MLPELMARCPVRSPHSRAISMERRISCAHLIVRGAFAKRRLAAEQLVGFLEDDGSAVGNDAVGGRADGGIGGDTRGGIRSATFDADDQVGEGDRDALDILLEHGAATLDAFGDGVLRAAFGLDRDQLDRFARFGDGGGDAGGVGAFAAEREDEHAADVRVLRDADHLAVRAGIGETVAPAGDDRVFELPGDAAGDFFGADDGEEDEQAIADADLSVGALVALDGDGAEVDWSVDGDGHGLPAGWVPLRL